MTTTATLTGAIAECRRCGAHRTITAAAFRDEAAHRCPDCNRWLYFSPIYGSQTAGRCDERCTDGTGKNCKCSCGGMNHGLTWRIS